MSNTNGTNELKRTNSQIMRMLNSEVQEEETDTKKDDKDKEVNKGLKKVSSGVNVISSATIEVEKGQIA